MKTSIQKRHLALPMALFLLTSTFLYADECEKPAIFHIDAPFATEAEQMAWSGMQEHRHTAVIHFLDAVAQALLSHAPPHLDVPSYQFYVVKSFDANAFVYPCNRIVFTHSEILEAESLDKLAVIMAHELAHIILGHTDDMHLHRPQKELEADVFAATVASRAGFKSRCLAKALKKRQRWNQKRRPSAVEEVDELYPPYEVRIHIYESAPREPRTHHELEVLFSHAQRALWRRW